MLVYLQRRKRATDFFALFGWIVLLTSGCAFSDSLPQLEVPPAVAAPALEPFQIITLGDIDPDDPAKKIKRFQPLANYLAQHLGEFGIQKGQVVIARDMAEMAQFLSDGTIDVYFDSPFPTLNVQKMSGSEVILRRWKNSVPIYHSVYITRRDSGATGLDDLVENTVAFEEPFSTSGFLLPAGTLIQRGYTLEEVDQPGESIPSGQVGYFFTFDEENAIELVLQGQVIAAGISNQDFDKLPTEFREQLIVLERTISVPRQLASVRTDLDPKLVTMIQEILVGLDQSEEGREILAGIKKTKMFDLLSPDSEAALEELKELMRLVAQN